jgi:hypothetical protein
MKRGKLYLKRTISDEIGQQVQSGVKRDGAGSKVSPNEGRDGSVA